MKGPAGSSTTGRSTITATIAPAAIIALGGADTGSGVAISATLGVAFTITITGRAAGGGAGVALIIIAIRFVGSGCGRAGSRTVAIEVCLHFAVIVDAFSCLANHRGGLLLTGSIGIAGPSFPANAAIPSIAMVTRIGPGLDIGALTVGLVG